MATASAVTLGVLAADPGARDLVAADNTAADVSAGTFVKHTVSRSDDRLNAHKLETAAERTATLRAVEKAHTKMWTTTVLNLWSDSGDDAAQVGELEAGKPVLVTGRKTA